MKKKSFIGSTTVDTNLVQKLSFVQYAKECKPYFPENIMEITSILKINNC